MEAPKRLYLSKTIYSTRLYQVPDPDDKTVVEYTRTDALIEKALDFLNGCIPDYIDLKHANVDTFMNVDNKRFIDEFRKHMEE